MTNNELKQEIKEHISIRFDFESLDGVRVLLYWDDELLSVTVSPRMLVIANSKSEGVNFIDAVHKAYQSK